MLSVILVAIALIVSTVRDGSNRSLICILILLPSIAHYSFFNDSVNFEYYGTAAVVSVFIITALNYLPTTPLSADLQAINFMYIIAHFIGWVMYNAYLEPFWYNTLVLTIFVIEFLRLIVITKKDIRHGAFSRFDSIHFNDTRHSVRGGG